MRLCIIYFLNFVKGIYIYIIIFTYVWNVQKYRKQLIIARIRYQIFFYATSILFQTRQCSCTCNKTTSWIPRSKDIQKLISFRCFQTL